MQGTTLVVLAVGAGAVAWYLMRSRQPGSGQTLTPQAGAMVAAGSNSVMLATPGAKPMEVAKVKSNKKKPKKSALGKAFGLVRTVAKSKIGRTAIVGAASVYGTPAGGAAANMAINRL